MLYLHSSAGRYGADRQLLSIAGGLDRARYRPIVVLPARGELGRLLDEAGVETHVRPLAVLRQGLVSINGLVGLSARLRRDVRELRSLPGADDVSLVHSNTSVVLSGQPVASALGARHLIHVREIYAGAGGAVASRLWPLLRARLLHADALACVSGAVARQFGESPQAFVLYDGLPAPPVAPSRSQARRALGLSEHVFVVALLGRVSAWKGQDVLAHALADPALSEAVGLVAGDAFPGEERHEMAIADLRDRLGLGERLRLLGFREDTPNVLAASDVVAVPSTRPDPLPNSAIEAALAGLPVVAAAHGGLPEIVQDGETGLLVTPGDPAALAGALHELATDPARRARMGEAAGRHARTLFSVERMLVDIQERYDALLSPAA